MEHDIRLPEYAFVGSAAKGVVVGCLIHHALIHHPWEGAAWPANGVRYPLDPMTSWLIWGRLLLAGSTPSVEWDAPPGCGSEEALLDSIASFMRADLPEDAAEQVTVRVDIEEGGDNFTAHVSVSTPLGESRREIEAPSCEQAISGAAIVVAVALDPLVVAETLEQAPATKPAEPSGAPAKEPPAPAKPDPAPALEPASEPEREPASPARTPPPVRATLGADGVFDTSSLGAPSFGARLSLGLDRGRLGLRLVGTYLAPTRRSVPGSSSAAVEVQMGTVGTQACFMPNVGRLELPSCAVFEAGAVRGRTIDTAEPDTGHEPYVAAGISAAVRWRVIPRLSLGLGAEGMALLFRSRFLVGDTIAYTAGPATLRVVLGLEVRL